MAKKFPSIGEVVKRLRHDKGLSTYQLARISNGEINRNWLSSLESGRIKDPPPEKMELLCKYLDATLADIYREAGIIEFPPTNEIQSIRERTLLEDFRRLPTTLQDALIELAKKLPRTGAG